MDNNKATWTVLRHSGRGDENAWRTCYEGSDEGRARRVYQKLYLDMHSGAVRMLHNGETVKQEWAYRMCTRW